MAQQHFADPVLLAAPALEGEGDAPHAGLRWAPDTAAAAAAAAAAVHTLRPEQANSADTVYVYVSV
jgi:hypothetical protein